MKAVTGEVEQSGDLLAMLAISDNPQHRRDLEKNLSEMFLAIAMGSDAQLPKAIWNFFLQILSRNPEQFPRASAIIRDRNTAKINHRRRKQALIRSLKLNCNASARDEFLSHLDELYLPQLETPWPPKDVWVSESPATGPLWKDHLQSVKLHDNRGKRKDVLVIAGDEGWAKVVRADESTIVFDEKSGEIILVVIRRFCGDSEVLKWINSIAAHAVGIKKSIRLDDPGKIVLNGYTPGARSAPCVMWAKNLLRSSTKEFESPKELCDFDFRVSSTYALFWNMMRSQLPPAILSDMHTFSGKDGSRAVMDGHGTMGGYYGIELASGYFEFHSAELAPPQGNYAKNYARFTHHEKNAHEFVTIWTTDRREGQSAHGNFYLSSHGIKVESATDTFFAFRGEMYHGTTLANVEPSRLDADFQQISIGFATGRRLLKVLGSVHAGDISESDMVVQLQQLGDNHSEEEE
ncbi:hypothetical protein BZA77DRAFT_308612 [Pyronema omphalodes]|nr:hypothetical protein BZA77DRAFT_308598 [Pyronema omphalodes]KAI5817842.1 hypothetical protein BZA77DRAFT_308612 [Pyronema omphalodes]